MAAFVQYVFGSLISRRNTYQLLLDVWKQVNVVRQPPLLADNCSLRNDECRSCVVSCLAATTHTHQFNGLFPGLTVLGKRFTPIVPLFTKQRNW